MSNIGQISQLFRHYWKQRKKATNNVINILKLFGHVYTYIYKLAIAGQTAEPNLLKLG